MEEDAALRDVVKKALEGKGVLAQIRASLRAAVFTVVDEHERASGVHVPNPSALGVKHDVLGRLSLQLVADFLEHWQLHQTLSILKLETDLAEGDVLHREELESIVGSDGVAAAIAGNGETKSSGDRTAPVLHQLLRAVSRGEGRGEGNGLPLPAGAIGIGSRATGDDDDDLGGGGARFSSLSVSLRGGGDLTQRSGQEQKELEMDEKGDTEDEQEEQQWEEEGEEEEDEEEEREIELGLEGDGPSRITRRRRRAGDRVGGGSGVDGEALLALSDTTAAAAAPPPPPPPPSPPVAEAGELGGGEFAAAPSPQPSPPPGRSQSPPLPRERDADADVEAGGPGSHHPTAPSAAAGQDGDGPNHYDGSMDERSYHFSEEAASADGAAQSPAGVTAAAAGMTGSDQGAWSRNYEYSEAAAAAAVGSASSPRRAVGEEEGSPGYRRPGRVGSDGVSQDDSGSRCQADTTNGVGDDGRSLRGGSGGGGADQKSPSGDAGGAMDEYEWDGDEEGGHEYEEDDDYEDDDDFHGDDDGDEVAEEALPPTDDDGGGGVGDEGEEDVFEARGSEGLDEEAVRVADLEWEARIGLSAESSVAVGLGEDGDGFDGEAYDEIEDAQSVS